MSEELEALANELFDLARAGQHERLAAYIDAGAPVDMRNANGDTFLTLAAYHDVPETVAMLIAKGADVEAENDRGQRALACATFKKDLASAKLLVDAGADPDGGTPSPRDTAKMFGADEILELFA